MSYPVNISITNPGAETGNTTGWTIESGSWGVRNASPSPYAGSYYFFAGTSVDSKVSQEIDLVNQGVVADDIDSGTLAFYMEVYRASYDNSDPGYFGFRFKDSSKNILFEVLSKMEIISPSQTWVKKSLKHRIPHNTRYINLILCSRRTSGTNNDSYFDNISANVDTYLSLYGTDPPDEIMLPIPNNGAEYGTTGWTIEAGAISSIFTDSYIYNFSHAGQYFWLGTGGYQVNDRMSCEIDLVVGGVSTSDIDNGLKGIRLEAYCSSTRTDSDTGFMTIRFKDSSKNIISSISSDTENYPEAWELRTLSGELPPYTRYIDIVLNFNFTFGSTNADAYFDDLMCYVTNSETPHPPADQFGPMMWIF
ncbi:hypothetical protein [Immundisolibacter sp.]